MFNLEKIIQINFKGGIEALENIQSLLLFKSKLILRQIVLLDSLILFFRFVFQ